MTIGIYIATLKDGNSEEFETQIDLDETESGWTVTSLNGEVLEFSKEKYETLIMKTFRPFSPA